MRNGEVLTGKGEERKVVMKVIRKRKNPFVGSCTVGYAAKDQRGKSGRKERTGNKKGWNA